MDVQALAKSLAEHPDYRVVVRYQRPLAYHVPAPGSSMQKGLIVDVETTGVDPEKDEIIELALLAFEYSKEGLVYRLLEEYTGFEEPKKPIPEMITELTGITPQMVEGHRLEDRAVNALVEESDVLIAHNAQFDRRFLERRFPIFAQKPWGCSQHQIPWKMYGIESAKLNYIAYRYGFFYEGHRALNDCEACLHVLAQPLFDSGKTGLGCLLETARLPTVRLFAVNAPFSEKDKLRARGYYWNDGNNGRPRAWYRDIPVEEKNQELEYLEQEIFGREVDLPIVQVDAWNRFSDRI